MNSKTYVITAILSAFAAATQAHQGTSLDEASREISAAADRGQDIFRAHGSTSQVGASGTGEAAAQRDVKRAEVLAELQLHRESGLAAFDGVDAPVWETAAYKEAAERYDALRNSPRYAALVQQYGGYARGDSMALSSGR